MHADLIYNIPEETLKGFFGGVRIDCSAGSGGRAGTRKKDAENWLLKNNAFATNVHVGRHHFGPIPRGSYYMRPHEKKANIVRLDPFPSNLMFGRNGFLIHSRGPTGSHGCIVPYDFNDVLQICKAVKSASGQGKGKPVLQVIAVGADLDRKFYTA